MDIIAHNKRYLPHEITTKENAVKLYRLTKDISFVCRRYHISKASLMRWNKLYDGTKESLLPQLAQAPHNPSGRPYAGGLEVDHGSAPAKPKHLCLRDVHQAAGEARLQPPPRFFVPCVCTAWLP